MKSKRINIGLWLYILLTVLPLGAGLIYALLYASGLTGILNTGATSANWQQVFSRELFLSLLYSGGIALVVMLITVFLAIVTTVHHHTKINKGWVSYLAYLPLAVPAIVAGFFTLQLLGNAGLLARFAAGLGLISTPADFPDMVNDTWAIGIIVSHIMLAFPFFLLLYVNLYKNELLSELEQLSATLGANPKDIFRKVQLPVLLKRSMPTVVLYYLFVFGSYEIPLILGQQSPQMVSVLVIRKLSRFNLADAPQAYGIAAVYTVLVIVSVLVYFKRKGAQHAT